MGGMNVWMYYFRHRPLVHTPDEYFRRGSCHSCELSFFFHSSYVAPGEEAALSAAMVGHLAAMAAGGEPNVPRWPRYSEHDGEWYLQYEVASEGGLVFQRGLKNTECDFWDKVGYPEPDCNLTPWHLCLNSTANTDTIGQTMYG